MENNDIILAPTMGEYLKEGYLEEMNLSQQYLSEATGLSKSHISKILSNKIAVTAETSIILGRFFGKSKGFFLRVQNSLNLRIAERDIKNKLDRVKPYEWKDEEAA